MTTHTDDDAEFVTGMAALDVADFYHRALDRPAALRLGRGEARRLYAIHTRGPVPGDFPGALIGAWLAAIRPLSALTPAQWRSMFDATGFIVDGEPAPPPADPVTVWRGAGVGRDACRECKRYTHNEIRHPALGWSWTGDHGKATEYAEGCNGVVWRVTASPAALLAHLPEAQDEWIVDTRQLTDRPTMEED